MHNENIVKTGKSTNTDGIDVKPELKMIWVIRTKWSIRKWYNNKFLVPHLNISSVRNRFKSLVDQINGKVDILIISGKK